MTKIRVLNQADMLHVVTMKDIIEANRQAMKLYSSQQVDIPLRVNLNVTEHAGQSLYMTGYAGEADALGVKIVSVYPGNIEKGITSVPATMVLLDPETGVVNCFMDGTLLTQLRTGAISGLATELLAKQDASVMLLIGTGGQAATQLEAVLTVRDIRQVYVSDLNFERAAQFSQAMQEKFGESFSVTIEPVKSVSEVIGKADIITAVTTSKQPVFSSAELKPGAHVNGVGSFMPDMSEIDPNIFAKAKVVYVDTMDAFTEAGDFQKPLMQGAISEKIVTGEIGQLVLGQTPGRSSQDDITFFKTTGNAVLDIVAARRIYELAAEKNIGQMIEL